MLSATWNVYRLRSNLIFLSVTVIQSNFSLSSYTLNFASGVRRVLKTGRMTVTSACAELVRLNSCISLSVQTHCIGYLKIVVCNYKETVVRSETWFYSCVERVWFLVLNFRILFLLFLCMLKCKTKWHFDRSIGKE